MSLTILDLTDAKRAISESGMQNPASRHALEAASPLIFYGSPADLEGGFRRVSQPSSPWRDLLPPMQWNMQRVAYYLYVTNPLARRIVELTKDFVVGEGIHIRATHPAVQKILSDFWNDPANN